MTAPTAHGRDRYFRPRAPMPWQSEAACKGKVALFYFEPGSGRSAEKAEEAAKFICRGCPVMHECREYALDNGETEGVWGAMTPEERRRLKRARRARRTG